MFEHVMAARHRLEGQAHVTPVMTSATFNDRVGAEVFFKCENFQRIGAFKFRGAYNAVACLPEDVRSKGVITFSSGNHAQAVALVGRLMDVPVTVGVYWYHPTIIRTLSPDRERPRWKCTVRSDRWICCWCPAGAGGCSAARRWPPMV